MTPAVAAGPTYRAAAVAAASTLALYLFTLAPTAAFWDAGEYIAAACGLGIPHPPGNPFFVLIGRVACMSPIAADAAVRLNVLTALASALSAGVWFLLAERVAARWLAARWQRWMVGGMATLIGATAFTVWNQSVVSEKVYTLALTGLALVTWLTVRWLDEPDAPRADRKLLLAAYLLGLGYANHMIGMIAAPAVVLAVVMKRPRMLLRWRLIGVAILLAMLGMTPFATQPIRAAHFPAINEGEVTGCATELRLDCTLSAATWERFSDHFQRRQYGKPSLVDRQAPLSAQIGMWWLYFKWQWLRDVHGDHHGLQRTIAVAFFLLGLLGAVVHRRRDPDSFAVVAPLVAFTTLGLVYYLNFRYGWSQSPELGASVDREVRDRDYFYIWSFSLWGIWTALGLAALWTSAARAIDRASRRDSRLASVRKPAMILALPIWAIALVPLVGNWSSAPRSGETAALEFARDVLNSVEPYGVLFTVGDNDSFPLWYAQEVQGIRKDVTVALTPYIDTEWYPRQLARRPVHSYDAIRGPALYRGRTWHPPSRPLLEDGAEAFPEAIALPTPQRFTHAGVSIAVPAGYLLRGDIVMLRTIKDSFPDRPIYFTRGATRNFDLRAHLLEQGLVFKLVADPLRAAGQVAQTPDGYLDVERSVALWTTVYGGPEAIARRGDWIDRPSISIPVTYVDSGLKVAQAIAMHGDRGTAQQLVARVEPVVASARLESLFLPAEPRAPDGGAPDDRARRDR